MRELLSIGFLLIFVLVSVPSIAAKRGIIDLNKNRGSVSFLAVGKPSFLKIRGKKATLRGKILITTNYISGKFVVPLDEFDTGMGLRNTHMKEKYLETDRFPTATLKFSRVRLPQNFLKDSSASVKDISFIGTLNLHGKTRKVKGVASLSRVGRRVLGQAEFKLNLTDFAIDIPSFKGITVAKEVTVATDIDAPMSLKK